MNSAVPGHAVIDRLAGEFLRRYRQGEHPTLSEYVRAYPEHAHEIRDLFPALIVMEQLAPGDANLAASSIQSPTEQPAPPTRLGDYRLIRELGRGGMGIVYEAEQTSLGRRVALKILNERYGRDERSLARFSREARSAAGLHHTNIVPVFEVGREGDACFYAMQLIIGQGLDQVRKELQALRQGEVRVAKSDNLAHSLWTGKFHLPLTQDVSAVPTAREDTPPLEVESQADRGVLSAKAFPSQPAVASSTETTTAPPSSASTHLSAISPNPRQYFANVARIGRDIAGALAYAHQRGVIHRDVKPSNLLLDASGTVWITDFGLAKTEDDGLTQSGELVGTLLFMSPERFRGQCDPRADVYGLGVTLYELLVLQPAFDATDRIRLMLQIRDDPPRLPRAVDPHIPRDLETIVLKAIEKDANQRYQTADELAADLQRFLDDEPIHARRISMPERLVRLWRRQPALVLLAVVSAVAVLALGGVLAGLFYSARLQTALDDTKAAHQRADAALEAAEQHQYFHRIARADTEWRDGSVGRVEQLLAQCPEERRRWEWFYLQRLCQGDLLTLRGHRGRVFAVTWSPDGRWLASASQDGTVRTWNAATGQELLVLGGHTDEVRDVACSPDGSLLASAGEDGTVRVWKARTGQEVHVIRRLGKTARSVEFSPDGRRFAAAFQDDVWVGDTTTGRQVLVFQAHRQWVYQVAWSPDGRRLATASFDRTVRLWDATTGRGLAVLPHPRWVSRVTFSPDGTRLASSSWDQTVRLWDVTTGRKLLDLGDHAGCASSATFSPDGGRIATASANGTVRIWDARTGQILDIVQGHTSSVRQIAFSPDGFRLATASHDETVRIWNAGEGIAPRTLEGHTAEVGDVAFSPDGTRLASAGNDRTTRIWDVTTAQSVLVLRGHTHKVWRLAFRPDGKRLASASLDKTARIWDAATGRPLLTLRGHRGWVRGVAFSPDGARVATASTDATVKLWDANTGRLLRTLEAQDKVDHLAFYPDGDRLVIVTWKGAVRVWSTATGQEVLSLEGHQGQVKTVVFSPDGTRFATPGADQVVKVWNAETGRCEQTLEGHQAEVFSVAFSPDGSRLASAGRGGVVKLWDTTTGQEVLTLRQHDGEVYALTFSPDGGLLASAGFDRTVKLWDARPVTVETPVERAALGLLDSLFAAPLGRDDVRDYLATLPGVSSTVRDRALSLSERYRATTDPERFHQASRAIVRQPYLHPAQYRLALRQAEQACTLAPNEGRYRATLGVARYRAGQFHEALAALDGAGGAGQIFRAMTLCRLGQRKEAEAVLAEVRRARTTSAWGQQDEVQAFLREADALLQQPAP